MFKVFIENHAILLKCNVKCICYPYKKVTVCVYVGVCVSLPKNLANR